MKAVFEVSDSTSHVHLTLTDFCSIQIVFPALQSQSCYVAKQFYRLTEGDSDKSDEQEVHALQLPKAETRSASHSMRIHSMSRRRLTGGIILMKGI